MSHKRRRRDYGAKTGPVQIFQATAKGRRYVGEQPAYRPAQAAEIIATGSRKNRGHMD